MPEGRQGRVHLVEWVRTPGTTSLVDDTQAWGLKVDLEEERLGTGGTGASTGATGAA